MRVGIIGATEPHGCELCGKIAELRPYGKNGENICFECGMKDEPTTVAMFDKRLEQGAVDVEDLAAVIRGNLRRMQ